MRIVIARQNHETNTFSPVPTPLTAFRPLYGEAALAQAHGMKTALGAFYDYAVGLGAEVDCPLIAHAWPSAAVEDQAFDYMADFILSSVAKGCDMILLDLHGAMVTQSYPDGEAELLARIRKIAPNVPIGVALDLHGNLSQDFLAHCDAAAGFKTYPHIDMYETGELVCAMMEQIRLTGVRPNKALVQVPILAHTLPMNTTRPGVLTDLAQSARLLETRAGVQAVSVFGGFPIADIPDTGVSILVVTDPQVDATAVAQELGQMAWERRAEFIYDQKPLVQSLADARAATAGEKPGPVLILDHGDNCMSGGSCDNIDILAAMLSAGMTDVVAGPICDPDAVEQAFCAGQGAEITLKIGNKLVAKGFPAPQPSLEFSGKIISLGDGEYRISGPIYTGMVCNMGRCCVIQCGETRILISSEPHEPWDQAVFTSLGIAPLECQYLLLKSRMYCRPVFEPHAKAVVEAAGGGVTGSDNALFPFKHLRQPIYPLAPDMIWERVND